jgi:5-(carboxyamino)imidazole ribonucleotide mutase
MGRLKVSAWERPAAVPTRPDPRRLHQPREPLQSAATGPIPGPEVTVPESPQPLVAILTGSPNDVSKVAAAQQALEQVGVASELRVLSAHRTPELTVDYVRGAEARGVRVFIACAGMANHLAGVVAAHTLRPVIGVPLASGPLGGFDALLSTVQMPPGVPVATVAVDGARNAGLLAARILALDDPELGRRLAARLAADRSRYSATEPPPVS